MANWVKLQLQLENKEMLEKNQRMGIEAEVEVTYQPVMVDCDKICSYSKLYDDAAEEVSGLCELIADNGDVMIAKSTFKDLDAIIRKTSKP